MAATSCLCHTLGLAGYDHPRTEYRGGCVYLHVRRQLYKRQCRSCGARWDQLTLRGRSRRTILTLPVGRKRQYVVVRGHRQRCRKCGGIHREPIPFVTGNRRCSKVFAQYVIELCRIATLDDVALFLDNWIRQAQSIGNSFFATLADTLEGHREGLLAHFDHPISTGPLEGLNNKIKVLKRRAYGFRDMACFKLRLYFLHERMEGGGRSAFAG